ncbi:hypothetical protein D3C80_1871520 [compost metagenome]
MRSHTSRRDFTVNHINRSTAASKAAVRTSAERAHKRTGSVYDRAHIKGMKATSVITFRAYTHSCEVNQSSTDGECSRISRRTAHAISLGRYATTRHRQ